MSKKGYISVVVPLYNAQEYIQTCVKSVLQQSFKNFELILVDDGSTDESRNICEKLAQKDERIKFISSQNGGPSSARNIGIKSSLGELIYFLDVDDYIEEETLLTLFKEFEKTDVDLVVGDYKKIMKEETLDSGHSKYFENDTVLDRDEIMTYVRTYLSKPNRFPLFVYSWGRLFKSEIIKKHALVFDENLRTYEDVHFNFKYLEYVEKLSFLSNKGLYFHLLQDNFTSHSLKIFNEPENLFGYQKALDNVKSYSLKFGLNLESEIGDAFTGYTVIQLVRMCGQLNDLNRAPIYSAIKNLVNSEVTIKSIKHYRPTGNDSKIVPFLIRYKMVKVIMYVCQYKANKRYKK